jgi:hypothetical protein
MISRTVLVVLIYHRHKLTDRVIINYGAIYWQFKLTVHVSSFDILEVECRVPTEVVTLFVDEILRGSGQQSILGIRFLMSG